MEVSKVNVDALLVFGVFIFSMISGLYFGSYIWGHNDGSMGFISFCIAMSLVMFELSRTEGEKR